VKLWSRFILADIYIGHGRSIRKRFECAQRYSVSGERNERKKPLNRNEIPGTQKCKEFIFSYFFGKTVGIGKLKSCHYCVAYPCSMIDNCELL
jgi:hypothetical protein